MQGKQRHVAKSTAEIGLLLPRQPSVPVNRCRRRINNIIGQTEGDRVKRFLNVAWNGLAASSAIVFTATCVLWVRSYSVNDRSQIALSKNRGVALWTWKGTTRVAYATSTGADWKSQWAIDKANWDYKILYPRFRLDRGADGKGHQWWGVTLPDWFVTAGTLPVLAGWIMTRKPKNVSGLCPVCGYDLRATPQRCPECGTISGGQPRGTS
jgi:hypothetical protein